MLTEFEDQGGTTRGLVNHSPGFESRQLAKCPEAAAGGPRI